MNADVLGSSVAGQPVVHVSGVIVLVLVVFARTWVESLVVVAHEGGHIALGVLTGRYNGSFKVGETVGGGETAVRLDWGAGAILILLAGYVTPPLVGLAGVALVLDGRAWSLLWVVVLLLLAAYFQARDFFTTLVVLIAGGGIGWVAVSGGPDLQTGLAVALVWLLLIGGVSSLVGQGFGTEGSDAAQLARVTLVPRILWVALFWFVATVCLWVGARRLLGV